MSKKMHTNENGQTILIMIFIMSIALAVGVALSNRFVSNLRTSTRVNTSYRAQAVADAAIERILTKSTQELQDFIDYGTCGSDCTLQLTNSDGVTETATIQLSNLGGTSDPYLTKALVDAPTEVLLSGYSNNTNVEICWDTPTSALNLPIITGYIVTGTVGNYEATSWGVNNVGSIYTNGFSEAVGAHGYDNCFTVNSGTNPQMLRFRSIYQDLDVAVIPSGSEVIPQQGILIESTGVTLDATQKVSVVRGTNVVPGVFDYVLYSKSTSTPLSN